MSLLHSHLSLSMHSSLDQQLLAIVFLNLITLLRPPSILTTLLLCTCNLALVMLTVARRLNSTVNDAAYANVRLANLKYQINASTRFEEWVVFCPVAAPQDCGLTTPQQ